jgi:hypothetical protein
MITTFGVWSTGASGKSIMGYFLLRGGTGFGARAVATKGQFAAWRAGRRPRVIPGRAAIMCVATHK